MDFWINKRKSLDILPADLLLWFSLFTSFPLLSHVLSLSLIRNLEACSSLNFINWNAKRVYEGWLHARAVFISYLHVHILVIIFIWNKIILKTVNRHLLFHATNIFLFTYIVNLNLEEFPITPSPFLSADKKTNEIYFKNGNYRYLCCHHPPSSNFQKRCYVPTLSWT